MLEIQSFRLLLYDRKAVHAGNAFLYHSNQRRSGGRRMDCREVQKSFIPFIDDQLSIRDLEAFLNHLESCENCREEYDVYYTLIAGMRYLESDNPDAFRFDSGQKLESAQEYLLQYKVVFVEKLIVFLLLCITAILFL